ncbi:MAG: NIPSNAP family protein [Alphaproteobacteria bacterium]|nr:NIPSNAP family protein [Alphaproteobacteria bacterium]MBV9015020.1 NIPSNAP family protein [Alphaproteobacteria bacterium]MBV9150499.1 NIPSNAP family protein [Alphaproteobacteria bacterium]MBV9584102.1 NIPSNAP family protein [Alphaproteobacteria bacterium]MBV9964943.1 NIPSNAP family protein [Alphaproteobacteria bacterium]
MIIEMRTYRLKPGSVAEVEKRFGEALRDRVKVSPLGAFFHTEVGPLNRIIHCWPYENLGERTRLRGEAMKLPNWPPKTQEFLEEMESKIIIPAPFSPKLEARRLGNLYEIRTYTMLPGAAPTVIEKWAERIEGRTKLSPLAFCGHTELGGLNQWIHVWAYKDAAERFRIRDEARATGAWPPATRGQFVKQENMFVIPAEFSPLR